MKIRLPAIVVFAVVIGLIQWQIFTLRSMISDANPSDKVAHHFALLDMDVERLDRQMTQLRSDLEQVNRDLGMMKR